MTQAPNTAALTALLQNAARALTEARELTAGRPPGDSVRIAVMDAIDAVELAAMRLSDRRTK